MEKEKSRQRDSTVNLPTVFIQRKYKQDNNIPPQKLNIFIKIHLASLNEMYS